MICRASFPRDIVCEFTSQKFDYSNDMLVFAGLQGLDACGIWSEKLCDLM